MHLGGVLPQPRGQHMFGLFDGDAIDMVDHLAHRIIAHPVRLARKGKVIAAEIQPFRDQQRRRIDDLGQIGHHRIWRGRREIALFHHHPAHIVQHRLPVLIDPLRAHIDHAGLPVRVLFQPDHRAFRPQRITCLLYTSRCV